MCPTNIPNLPTTPIPVITQAPLIINQVASNLFKNIICQGNEIIIDIPSNNILFPVNYYYAVSSTSTCSIIR